MELVVNYLIIIYSKVGMGERRFFNLRDPLPFVSSEAFSFTGCIAVRDGPFGTPSFFAEISPRWVNAETEAMVDHWIYQVTLLEEQVMRLGLV